MRTKVEHSATAVKRGGVKRRVVHNSQSWGFCREREVNEAGSRRAATDDVDRPRLRVKTQSTCTWRRQLWGGFRPFSDRDERQVCANSGHSFSHGERANRPFAALPCPSDLTIRGIDRRRDVQRHAPMGRRSSGHRRPSLPWALRPSRPGRG
jgi:hypothetical protein